MAVFVVIKLVIDFRYFFQLILEEHALSRSRKINAAPGPANTHRAVKFLSAPVTKICAMPRLQSHQPLIQVKLLTFSMIERISCTANVIQVWTNVTAQRYWTSCCAYSCQFNLLQLRISRTRHRRLRKRALRSIGDRGVANQMQHFLWSEENNQTGWTKWAWSCRKHSWTLRKIKLYANK